jgi:hypothetical protein
MAAQDVIRFLLPVQLHDDREHKQVMPAPTAPTSPRILLAKQLYYDSSKSDVPSVTFPCVQQQQLVTPAPTGPIDVQMFEESSVGVLAFMSKRSSPVSNVIHSVRHALHINLQMFVCLQAVFFIGR